MIMETRGKRGLGIPLFMLTACLLAGCEPSDDEVRGELDVSPSSTSLEGETKSVILTADVSTGGATTPEVIVYPLNWSVDAADVGEITSQSADKAVYTHVSTNAGSNVITVRDQLGREGLATVHWQPASTNAP